MAKTIEDYKKDYAAAAARGDAAGMKAANDGANAIRASQGQKAEVASADIAKVASGGTSGIVSNPDRWDASSGTSSKSSGTSSGGGSATGSSTTGYTKYTGGNSELDAAIAKYSEMYAAAKAAGDAVGMRNANDAANRLRNQYGYAAEFANEDIVKVAASSAAAEKKTAPSTGRGGVAVNDYSNYLEEMYAAQKKAALAQLSSAYTQNLNALERAGIGLDTKYQAARNQAAGASELAARNFQEYAAAAGLNSGAGGQAELARNIALQNDLNELTTQEATTLADLELQRAQAETEFNTAIAQAEAQGDYELAAALYQEKVRQNEAALQQQMLAYEAQRDAVADSQWQQNFDRQVASQLADYGTAFLGQGIMPSPEMLTAMGMTSEDAKRYLNQQSLVASMEEAAGDPTPVGYNNGSLSADQVKELQGLLGLAQDGFWGPNSQAQTGMGADEAWAAYFGGGLSSGGESLYKQLYSIPGLTQTNKVAMVESALKSGRISNADANYLLSYLGY